ncbi:hypothetical protein ACOMHN_040579 [Nucella lapillus]
MKPHFSNYFISCQQQNTDHSGLLTTPQNHSHPKSKNATHKKGSLTIPESLSSKQENNTPEKQEIYQLSNEAIQPSPDLQLKADLAATLLWSVSGGGGRSSDCPLTIDGYGRKVQRSAAVKPGQLNGWGLRFGSHGGITVRNVDKL